MQDWSLSFPCDLENSLCNICIVRLPFHGNCILADDKLAASSSLLNTFCTILLCWKLNTLSELWRSGFSISLTIFSTMLLTDSLVSVSAKSFVTSLTRQIISNASGGFSKLSGFLRIISSSPISFPTFSVAGILSSCASPALLHSCTALLKKSGILNKLERRVDGTTPKTIIIRPQHNN